MEFDSEALEWLKAANPGNWREELNGLLLFYHESSGFHPPGWEPGKMEQAPPQPAPEFTL